MAVLRFFQVLVPSIGAAGKNVNRKSVQKHGAAPDFFCFKAQKRRPRSPGAPLPIRLGLKRKRGGLASSPSLSHWASALPMARQASKAVSSGASQQMTLGTARPMLDSSQSFSQVRIQSPLPQP